MIARLQRDRTQEQALKPQGREQPERGARLFYLDWLRVLAVFGVFLAHTGDIFDTLYWHTRRGGPGIHWDALATFGAQWGMSLVFLLAGASAWFALSSRTSRQFIEERFKRLFIPFVVAFLLLSPIQAYFLAYFLATGYSSYHGTFLAFFPYFFEHILIGKDLKWLSIYGYHLWFLAFLFLISIISLPALSWLKRGRGLRFISRLAAICKRPGGLLVFVVPLATIRILLWTLFPGYQGWTDFFGWLCIFVCGFMLIADKSFEAAIQKQWKLFLPLAIVCIATLIVANVAGALSGWEYAPGYSAVYLLYQFLLSLTSWSLTVCALALAIHCLNFNNNVLRYANEAVLPFYVIHQPVLVVIAFYIVAWNLPSVVTYLFVSLAALVVTLDLYEFLIRRVKLLRLLFGMKAESTLKPAQPNVPA